MRRNNVPAARMLRRDASAVESLLWEQLRDRRFRDPKFRRQRPVGPFVLDFYCPVLKLAIEVDGPQHDEPDQAAHDQARTNALMRLGIRVLRIRADHAARDPHGALDAAFSVLDPSPPLPLPGEGAGVRVERHSTSVTSRRRAPAWEGE